MLFGVGAVLARYVDFTTSPDSLVRPILVVAIGSLLLLLITGAIAHDWDWSAMFVSALTLVTLRQYLLGLALGTVCLWWIVIRVLRRWRRRVPPGQMLAATSRATSILSLVYAAVMAVSAWSVTTSVPQFAYPSYGAGGTGGPNIYLILLDGYPRADTLEQTFSIDNEPFLGELGDLGFIVSEAARSNYNKTWSTLASMLNGAYVDEMMGGQEAPERNATQIRWLYDMINRASMLDVLRERGYEIVTIPEAFRSTALMSADEVLDDGDLTEFEVNLLSFSPWATLAKEPLRQVLADAQDHSVRDSLTTTTTLAAEDQSAPRFVFSHVQSPHTPFVLHGENVQRPALPDCFPTRCAFWNATIQETGMEFVDYRRALEVQLAELNSLVLSMLRDITASDPEAVIIVMSDHGARYSLDDTAEHYRAFLAARTPGRDELYEQDESPVNLLRNLFAAYFDAQLKPLPYEAWFSPWVDPLQLEQIQPVGP